MPLETTAVDLLDRAHSMLTDPKAPDLTDEELREVGAAVSRLMTAVNMHIRRTETPAESAFSDFLAEHPELGWLRP
jgi:hypothetical protein